MYKWQMHFHTKESSACATIGAEAGIREFQKSGYDGVIVTDHFSEAALGKPGSAPWSEIADRFLTGYHCARSAAEKEGIRVLLGMEIRFPGDENDFLVYGFSPSFLYEHPWMYMGDLRQFRELTKKQRLFLAQAHPFRSVCTPADPSYLDGVEVNNGNIRHNSHNAQALSWARAHQLREIVGADFHEAGDLCCNPVFFKRQPEDEQELAKLLREGTFRYLTQVNNEYQDS